ncbi:DUF960 family protein [Clostridium drakei]|uniref:DUF960 domain-containing protein n=1 Tax=Clostridium drakei TaxID=332101 RepID=A0A2U8DLL8_9CLOT|nr:DUF960 family protein [Clostridium drakei]AWI03102.1 hypothetical protein B9W14_00795 [Clostridium drakei]
MFDKNRYITRGVKEEIGLDIQILIWSYIDALKKRKDINVDYLQVFELNTINRNDIFNQKLVHKQELAPYEKLYLLNVEEPVNKKVYVIDEGDYSTMLLAEEY